MENALIQSTIFHLNVSFCSLLKNTKFLEIFTNAEQRNQWRLFRSTLTTSDVKE